VRYELIFGLTDIDRWARFSGDYNPIHFDAAEARQLGADGVIAHGMLVLLAIKARLSVTLAPDGGWWLARARMRQPVLAEEAVLLDTRPQSDGVAFSLTSRAGRKLVIGSVGRLMAAPDGAAQDPSTRRGSPADSTDTGCRHHLTPEALAGRIGELNRAFPRLGELWVAADALVFAEFLRTQVKDILAPYGIDLSRTARASGNGTVLVQATHDVVFDRAFLGGDGPRSAGLDIDMLPPETEDVEDGISATCQLVSRCKDRVVMLTSLGLFIRHAPQGPFHKE